MQSENVRWAKSVFIISAAFWPIPDLIFRHRLPFGIHARQSGKLRIFNARQLFAFARDIFLPLPMFTHQLNGENLFPKMS